MKLNFIYSWLGTEMYTSRRFVSLVISRKQKTATKNNFCSQQERKCIYWCSVFFPRRARSDLSNDIADNALAHLLIKRYYVLRPRFNNVVRETRNLLLFELTQISVWDFQLGWYQTILRRGVLFYFSSLPSRVIQHDAPWRNVTLQTARAR